MEALPSTTGLGRPPTNTSAPRGRGDTPAQHGAQSPGKDKRPHHLSPLCVLIRLLSSAGQRPLELTEIGGLIHWGREAPPLCLCPSSARSASEGGGGAGGQGLREGHGCKSPQALTRQPRPFGPPADSMSSGLQTPCSGFLPPSLHRSGAARMSCALCLREGMTQTGENTGTRAWVPKGLSL